SERPEAIESEKRFKGIRHISHTDHIYRIIVFKPDNIAVRNNAATKSHRISFAHARSGLTGPAHFACESHFAKDRRALVYRNIAKARSYGSDYPQIGSRLVYRHPSRDVH